MNRKFPLRHLQNFVKNWRVKVFETRTSKNGDYFIMKGSVGAVKNEDGKYEGGLLVDVIVPIDYIIPDTQFNSYYVDGDIRWTINVDKNGIRHNNCTIWAETVKPYEYKKGR